MATAEFELEVGQMVGEYRVERKLGEGAFGKVYAAVHPLIGKTAAIKILKPEMASTKEMVDRFAAEARAVNQIRHRHIIDIFSFGTLPNGVHYFVMELLEGTTFQSYLRKNGPIDPALAFTILWPVARALGAAHKAGIAHRDLKPENVFLVQDQDGGMFPKLLDFGIAKLLSETDVTQKTRAGMVLGTPVYMSPEQCRATEVDHRADIYSFGIMLHEALTGSRPFDADNVMDVIMRQISDPPPKMSTCRPGLPPALDVPVLRMLEKAPARRPQTMSAVLDELTAAARTVGILTPATSSQASGGGAPVSGGGAGSGPVGAPTTATFAPAPGTTTGTGTVVTSSAAIAGAGVGAVPSLVAGPPSHAGAPTYAGPPSQGIAASYAVAPSQAGGASYAGPPSQAGGASYGGPPSQASPAAPSWGPGAPGAAGMGPVSGQAPSTEAKSRLPVVLGAVGGVVALVLVGVLVLGRGSSPSGSGAAGPVASGAPSATSSASGAGVKIGAAAPRVGRTFERETDSSLHADTFMPGAKKPVHSWAQQLHDKVKINILAVNEWNATRLEIQYTESFGVTKEDDAEAEKVVSATAGRAYFVAAQDSGATVVAVDGKVVTEDEKDEVLNSAGEMLEPRASVFRRSLVPGDSVSLPPNIAGPLLGLAEDGPFMSSRADAAVLKLVSVDRARKAAVFDVECSYFADYKEWKWTFTAPLKGTLTLDVPTGLPVAEKLSGPVVGTTTESGIKQELRGSVSFEIKGEVTP